MARAGTRAVKGYLSETVFVLHAMSNLTLLRGRKLWLMCNLSNVARELDRLGRDRREATSRTLCYLQSLMRTMTEQVFWGLLDPGQSLYLPYGWLHSVWTDVEEGRIFPMFSVEMSVRSVEVCGDVCGDVCSNSVSLISTSRLLVEGSSQVEVNKVDYCR